MRRRLSTNVATWSFPMTPPTITSLPATTEASSHWSAACREKSPFWLLARKRVQTGRFHSRLQTLLVINTLSLLSPDQHLYISSQLENKSSHQQTSNSQFKNNNASESEKNLKNKQKTHFFERNHKLTDCRQSSALTTDKPRPLPQPSLSSDPIRSPAFTQTTEPAFWAADGWTFRGSPISWESADCYLKCR